MLNLILPVVVGAFIGWVTNWLALKMLFHPRNPIRFGPFTIQGIVPRRRADIALKLGELVETELVSHGDLRQALQDPAMLADLNKVVEAQSRKFVSEKLPGLHPMVGMLMGKDLQEKLAGLLSTELQALLPNLVETAANGLESRLSFKDLVRKKVENFSVERVEGILYVILAKEFGFIEWSGAILGGIVGLGQALLFLVMR